MLARWYLMLGQFSVTFEYRPGSLHSNADGMSRQCGQCRRPDYPVSAADLPAVEAETQLLLVDQPFASSEMGFTWGQNTPDGTVMGRIRKCSAVAGLCRTFTGTTLLATTSRKSENSG